MSGKVGKGALLVMLCLALCGCNIFVKQLYISLPPLITAESIAPPTELDASVSTAYPVPDPTDGTSADLTVRLSVSGPGADKLYLNPATVVIARGTSVALFKVSALYDGTWAPNEQVTVTARAVGYEEDSATITIVLP